MADWHGMIINGNRDYNPKLKDGCGCFVKFRLEDCDPAFRVVKKINRDICSISRLNDI